MFAWEIAISRRVWFPVSTSDAKNIWKKESIGMRDDSFGRTYLEIHHVVDDDLSKRDALNIPYAWKESILCYLEVCRI